MWLRLKPRKDGTMELKELLGDDLYKQVQAKIDEKNSTETDKLKHVRYTDLSEGKYVSKEKYDSAQWTDHRQRHGDWQCK